MSSVKKSRVFDDVTGDEIKGILAQMDKDTIYNTEPSYSANGDKYPDHSMPFVDKHMNYLRTHPSIDPQQYISNLRLMTRIR